MKLYRIFLLFLLFIILPLDISAQDNVDIDKTLILSYAQSDDVQLHVKALDSIHIRLNKTGSIDSEIMQIVTAMAESSIRKETYEEGIRIKTDHNVQLKAIKLLGEISGQESLDSVTALLLLSNNQPLLLQSIHSSALIHAENYNEYLLALVKAMENQHILNQDNGFAYAAMSALDVLTEFEDVMLTPRIIEILLIYSSSGYIQSIRDLAMNLLRKY